MTQTDELKCHVLKKYFIPDEDFQKIFIHGHNRSCSLNYLDEQFVYSTSSDSIFYQLCTVVFITRKRERT